MDYADADFKDPYIEGPKGYRQTSENATKLNKNDPGLWKYLTVIWCVIFCPIYSESCFNVCKLYLLY